MLSAVDENGKFVFYQDEPVSKCETSLATRGEKSQAK